MELDTSYAYWSTSKDYYEAELCQLLTSSRDARTVEHHGQRSSKARLYSDITGLASICIFQAERLGTYSRMQKNSS